VLDQPAGMQSTRTDLVRNIADTKQESVAAQVNRAESTRSPPARDGPDDRLRQIKIRKNPLPPSSKILSGSLAVILLSLLLVRPPHRKYAHGLAAMCVKAHPYFLFDFSEDGVSLLLFILLHRPRCVENTPR
jgi:hypothetical protein